jgi:hypothetical protein
MKYGPLTKQISNSGCNQGDTNSFCLLHVASGVLLRCSQFQVNPVVKYISEQLNIPTDSRSLTTTNTSNGNWIIRCSVLWIAVWNCPHTYQGRIQWGAHPARAPLKLGKIWFFWRKIVIFHTKYPKILRTSLRSALFFWVRPPNLKSWIRPCIPICYKPKLQIQHLFLRSQTDRWTLMSSCLPRGYVFSGLVMM